MKLYRPCINFYIKSFLASTNTVVVCRCLWWVILKFSQKSFWDSWIFVYCQFKNYFTFITKKKLYFSLLLSEKESAPKVALQFAIRGLVAYKKKVYIN